MLTQAYYLLGKLFGWVDYQASITSKWANDRCIYRQSGGFPPADPTVAAPKSQDTGVDNMIWDIRGHIKTFCVLGQGATLPQSMYLAYIYQSTRCNRNTIKTKFNALGFRTEKLRELAAEIIIGMKTPVIIGTGWLSHYPLAYGYKFRSRKVKACKLCWWTKTEHERYFFVNQGWGGNNNGWVPASTWFVGQYM